MRRDVHPDVLTYHAKDAEAKAADAAYSAVITAVGYKNRWSLPSDAMRRHPEIADAFAHKVRADNEALEWFRRSFAVCHGAAS